MKNCNTLGLSPVTGRRRARLRVSVRESGYALIEKNVVDYNRHAMASQGTPGNGYYAPRNLVLSHGGTNNRTWNINTHMFDVHGTVSCWGFGKHCRDAGQTLDQEEAVGTLLLTKLVGWVLSHPTLPYLRNCAS
jgi:hypothetical protein